MIRLALTTALLAAAAGCAAAGQSAYYQADLDRCEEIVDAAGRSACELAAVEHRATRNAERISNKE